MELQKELTDLNKEKLLALELELNELRNRKLKGFIVRARADWIDNGEKPTSYFCNLEKKLLLINICLF